MKVICQVVAAVALFGIVLCTREGGDLETVTQGGSDRQCGIPLESGETEEHLAKIVVQMSVNCLWSHKKALEDKLDLTFTTETIQDTIKKFCELTPSYNNCTDSVLGYAQNCVDENLLELFRVEQETIQKLLRVACKDDGGRLVTIVQEGVKPENNAMLHAQVKKCFRSAYRVMENQFKENDNATERRAAYISVINDLRECFLDMPEQASALSHAFVSIMDDMLA